MKRTAYDSEYERVRREAGLSRARPEFPEADALPDLARVEAAHDDFKERMAEFSAHETRQRAEAKVRHDELSKHANQNILIGEYDRAGVLPPYVNGDGIPTVSLSMLRWIGWKIEETPEGRKLIAPASANRARKQRQDYEEST